MPIHARLTRSPALAGLEAGSSVPSTDFVKIVGRAVAAVIARAFFKNKRLDDSFMIIKWYYKLELF
jgi:hypothetical protein